MTNGFAKAMVTTLDTYNRHLAIAGELYTAEEQRQLRVASAALLSTLGTNLAEGHVFDKLAKTTS